MTARSHTATRRKDKRRRRQRLEIRNPDEDRRAQRRRTITLRQWSRWPGPGPLPNLERVDLYEAIDRIRVRTRAELHADAATEHPRGWGARAKATTQEPERSGARRGSHPRSVDSERWAA